MNDFTRLVGSQRWQVLLHAAIKALEDQGCQLTRLPGRGRASVYSMAKDGVQRKVCIRTTRDRLIAFPPQDGGRKWSTLDRVDSVVVATVDSKIAPRNIEVFLFPAIEVKKRFVAAYKARKSHNTYTKDNFGLWLSLDRNSQDSVYGVGSGICDDSQLSRIGVFKIVNLLDNVRTMSAPETEVADVKTNIALKRSEAIGEIVEWARARVAQIAQVDIKSIKVEVRVEF